MLNINSSYKEFNIVVRKNKKYPIEVIKRFLEQTTTQYFFIEHEKDRQPETGEIEGCHYHIVALLPKRKRGTTYLNELLVCINENNSNGIQIEKLSSLEGSVQYLIHKNDKDKTQHSPSEIVTNVSREELAIILEAENNSLSFDRIYNICKDSKDIIEVIERIGFTRYNMFRNTIRDILDCLKDRRVKTLNDIVTKSNKSVEKTLKEHSAR